MAGSTAGLEIVERPASMSVEVYTTLAKALDAHRDAAVKQARAAIQ